MKIINGSTPTIVFLMVDDTDLVTAETGVIPTVSLSANGGPFATAAGAVSEVGFGWYSVVLTEAETGTDGPIIVRANAADCQEWRDIVWVESSTPATLDSNEMNAIADHVLRRTAANAYESANGDATDNDSSLLALVLKHTGKTVLDPASDTLTIYDPSGNVVILSLNLVAAQTATTPYVQQSVDNS